MRYTIILLAPLVALLAACGGGEEETPSATPSTATARPTRMRTAKPSSTLAPSPITSPTVPPESAGIDGFRAFAAQVDEAVANGDVEFFSGRAIVNDYTCTGGEEFTQACWDQQPGTMVETFSVGFLESEGLAMTIAYYSDRFTEWFGTSHPELSDEYGGGTPVLHSLARVPPDEADSENLFSHFDRHCRSDRRRPRPAGPHLEVAVHGWPLAAHG